MSGSSRSSSPEALILSVAFRPAKPDESKRRTCAFRARLRWRYASDNIRRTHPEGKNIVWRFYRQRMHGSFVGSPSRSEGLRFLRMTASEGLTH